MSEDGRETQGESGRNRFMRSPLRLALAASVVANVFLLSVLLGQWAPGGGPDPVEGGSTKSNGAASEIASFSERVSPEGRAGGETRRRRGFIASIMAKASPGLRGLIEQAQAERASDFQQKREQIQALRRRRVELLADTPFDAAAFRALQAETLELSVAIRRMAYETFSLVAERATDEQRAELARLFRERRAARRALRRALDGQTAPQGGAERTAPE